MCFFIYFYNTISGSLEAMQLFCQNSITSSMDYFHTGSWQSLCIHWSLKYKKPQAVVWGEHDFLTVICTFVIPRAPIHTSLWATPAVTQQLTHPPTWAAPACQPRTAPGRRASWAIWQAAFGVCTTCWRACPRGTNRLLPLQPRAAPSLVQVLSPRTAVVPHCC